MSAVTGAPLLMRASMKQDGRNIAPWVVLISVLSASSILIYRWIFVTPEERISLATSLGLNPALSLIFGPAHDLSTADGFNAWRAGMLGALFAGLMALFVVVRNSRAQEDSGQAELLASGVMGRHTRLLVAIAMATVASLGLGVVSFLFTWGSGGEVAASAMLAATFTASGLFFASLAAVTSQLAADARTATSMAVGALGVLYALRGYLDFSGAPEWTRWATPFGWWAETDPAGEQRWLPLLISLGATLVLVGIAFVLQSWRDFALGMIPQRLGPSEGRRLRLLGLMRSLQGGTLVGWFIAFAALGLLFGNLVSSVRDLLGQNPGMGQIMMKAGLSSSDLSMGFVATVLQIFAIIAAVLGVQMIMRMYSEEVDYRVEPILAMPVRRQTYMATNVGVAFTATAVAMLVAGLGLALVANQQDDAVGFADVALQALATIPAVWVLVALAAAVVGAKPSKRIAGWAGVVATFGLTLLGPTFKLWDWALAISPLYHVPVVAASEPDWAGLAWLALPIGVFLLIAFAGYRRRDIV